MVWKVEVMLEAKESSQFDKMRAVKTEEGDGEEASVGFLFEESIGPANKVLFGIVLAKVYDVGTLAEVRL